MKKFLFITLMISSMASAMDMSSLIVQGASVPLSFMADRSFTAVAHGMQVCTGEVCKVIPWSEIGQMMRSVDTSQFAPIFARGLTGTMRSQDDGPSPLTGVLGVVKKGGALAGGMMLAHPYLSALGLGVFGVGYSYHSRLKRTWINHHADTRATMADMQEVHAGKMKESFESVKVDVNAAVDAVDVQQLVTALENFKGAFGSAEGAVKAKAQDYAAAMPVIVACLERVNASLNQFESDIRGSNRVAIQGLLGGIVTKLQKPGLNLDDQEVQAAIEGLPAVVGTLQQLFRAEGR